MATTSCKGVWNGMVVHSEKARQGVLGSIVSHTCAFEQKPTNGGEPGTAEQLCLCNQGTMVWDVLQGVERRNLNKILENYEPNAGVIALI